MAIERFKPQSEWSVDEITENRRTGAVPESEQYTQARRKALEDAGLEPEGGGEGDDEPSTDDYFKRLQAGGRR